MAKNNLIKIGGELISVAPDGIVADALAIMDYTSGRNKTQKTINDELIAGLADRYTKSEVNTLLEAINQFSVEVVSQLPNPPSEDTMGIIYLVPSSTPETQNIKDEFITVRSGSEGSYTYAWEQIGSTAIDLSDYVTDTELSAALATYVTTDALNTILNDGKISNQEIDTIVNS